MATTGYARDCTVAQWARTPAGIACLLLALTAIVGFTRSVCSLYDTAAFDMNIFIQAGARYWQTGELYERAAPAVMPVIYGPDTPIFKFPPAFQLQLAPVAAAANESAASFDSYHRNSDPRNLLRAAYIVLYAGACLLLVTLARRAYPAFQRSAAGYSFTAVSVSALLIQDAFRKDFDYMNFETPIFAMLVVALWVYPRFPRMAAVLIGYLAAVKIYPGLLLTFFAALRDRKSLGITVITTIGISAIALAVFGAKENLYFYRTVYPLISGEHVLAAANNFSVAGLLLLDLPALPLPELVFMLVNATVILCTFLLLKKYTDNSRAAQLRIFALLACCLLIYLRNNWSRYFIVAAFPLVSLLATHFADTGTHIFIRIARLTVIAAGTMTLVADLDWWIAARQQAYVFFNEHAETITPLYWMARMKALTPLLFWCLLSGECRAASGAAIQQTND